MREFVALSFAVFSGAVLCMSAASAEELAATARLSQAAPQPPGKMAPLASVPTAPAERPEQVYMEALGTVTANTVAVTAGVDGRLAYPGCVEGRPVIAGQLLATIESPQLHAQPRLADTPVRAPISGLAGFCRVDPGNFVHPGETLLTITQLQPIAVVFSIPQDTLPRVRALFGSGATPVVEVFDRNGGSVRLATGRLTAIDNEIDTTTGTISLKASFENKDGALYPNEFVNVRMLVGARESNRH
jgi:multidrug efflux pump subunit AcrA (membrane-fusion protein)